MSVWVLTDRYNGTVVGVYDDPEKPRRLMGRAPNMYLLTETTLLAG